MPEVSFVSIIPMGIKHPACAAQLPWLWEHIKAGAAYLWGVFVAHGWPRIKAMLAGVSGDLRKSKCRVLRYAVIVFE